MNKKYLEIIVKTTPVCNAACVYCSARSGPSAGPKLSLDTAGRLLEEVRRLLATGAYHQIRLLWHGGEPLLLGKDFYRRLCEFAVAPGIVHRIQTNLTLLDREWISILAPLLGNNGLGSSLDPFSSTRFLPGGDYNARWLDAVELLEDAGWRLGCVFVLHRKVLHQARDLYWFFRNLRDNSALSLRVNPLLPVGRGRFCDDSLRLRPGDYGRFLVELARVWLADRRALVIAPLHELVEGWQGRSSRLACDRAGVAGCTQAHLGMDAEGKIYNCGRAVDAGGDCFGNIHRDTLEQCLAHPARSVLLCRDVLLKAGACKGCACWPFCHGGCVYETHVASQGLASGTQLCEDYRHFYRWLQAEGPLSGNRLSDDVVHQDAADSQSPEELTLVYAGRDGSGLATALRLAKVGRSVKLAKLEEWPADDLLKLLDFFLYSPDSVAVIEPFYSAFRYLGPARQPWSLRRMYADMHLTAGGSVPSQTWRLHHELPCRTCECYKHCRAFWMYPTAQPEACRIWRRLHDRMLRVCE